MQAVLVHDTHTTSWHHALRCCLMAHTPRLPAVSRLSIEFTTSCVFTCDVPVSSRQLSNYCPTAALTTVTTTLTPWNHHHHDGSGSYHRHYKYSQQHATNADAPASPQQSPSFSLCFRCLEYRTKGPKQDTIGKFRSSPYCFHCGNVR